MLFLMMTDWMDYKGDLNQETINIWKNLITRVSNYHLEIVLQEFNNKNTPYIITS